MKRRTAAMLVIIFAAAFLLGADLSFFDVHLFGKARRVLDNMLPENTSHIVHVIADPMNTPVKRPNSISADPFLDSDFYKYDYTRAEAMCDVLTEHFVSAQIYTYRLGIYYSNTGDEYKAHLMKVENAMMQFLEYVIEDIKENELYNNNYKDGQALMNKIRFVRDYASRTYMEIYMGADITPELFEEYAEQYKAGVPLTEILD